MKMLNMSNHLKETELKMSSKKKRICKTKYLEMMEIFIIYKEFHIFNGLSSLLMRSSQNTSWKKQKKNAYEMITFRQHTLCQPFFKSKICLFFAFICHCFEHFISFHWTIFTNRKLNELFSSLKLVSVF